MVSKGNFLDFIEDAAKSKPLVDELLAEAYKPDETAQELLNFLYAKGYYGVTLADCFKLLNAVQVGPLPCNFNNAMY